MPNMSGMQRLRALLRAACRALLLLFAAGCTGPAFAAGKDGGGELVDLINAYRGEARNCEGRRIEAAGPLAATAALAAVRTTTDAGSLRQALKAQGYRAAKAQVIGLTGPTGAQQAMALLRQRYCRPLLSRDYAEIGVSQRGGAWQIVLARPLLSADLGDWRTAGREILRLANRARAQPRSCGSRRFDAAPPLAWAPRLAAASLAHSRDMARHDDFAHRGSDGSRVDKRTSREGYRWRQVGENIAAGQGSPQQAMAAWLSSPHHCENIMAPGFVDMGAAYAIDADSRATIYWTQVFGTPRGGGRR